MKSIFLPLLLSMTLLHAGATTAEEMFQKALVRGDIGTIENLLSSGLSANSADRYGQTHLGLALASNQAGVVELLLSWHADPNARRNGRTGTGEFPATPLQYAAQTGSVRLASMLIAAGAQVNPSGVTERTALHFAGHHLEMIQFLIEKGAEVNVRDTEGASALDDAVWTGSLDAAAILLAHGARLNDTDTHTGATPLNEAAFRGYAPIVEYLLRFHPDLDLADNAGRTPLDNAIRMRKEDCALLLLEAESKESLTAPFLAKLLDAAIRKDEPRVADSLIQHGAILNGSILEQATAAGDVKIVQILLDHGADPNLSSQNGSTPLEDAALKGLTGIARLLLDHGAEVNQINTGSGTTALYAAASFGKADTVKLLLARGADPRVCGSHRTSPYQAAVANGYNEVAVALRDHGGAEGCGR